jgi:nicotinamide-nucleotide amidase
LHGDVGDISPIQSLLKSWEVPAMARAIGIPERTWRATPTDGLGIDNGDEAQLGASYLEWDLVLLALFDAMASGTAFDDLPKALKAMDDPHALEVIENMTSRMAKSWFKRVNPICLTYPGQDRFGRVETLDQSLFQPSIMRRI